MVVDRFGEQRIWKSQSLQTTSLVSLASSPSLRNSWKALHFKGPVSREGTVTLHSNFLQGTQTGALVTSVSPPSSRMTQLEG